MSNPIHCPANILKLFEGDEEAKMVARARAIEWLEGLWPTLRAGDVVMVPDPETGLSTPYVKGDAQH